MKINNENFNIKIEELFNDLEISKKQSLVIHSSIYELYLLDHPQKKLWEL